MTVWHLTTNLAEASGVVTFVRELDAALNASGVASRIFTEAEPPPTPLACDVVHIHGLWRPAYHRLSRRAQAEGIPVVWSTHGMTAPWSLRHKGLKKKIAWLAYQRRDLRAAAVLHATTKQESEWNRRVLGRDSHVIPLGTRLPPTSDARQPVRADQQPTAKNQLLFVGRVFKVKAIDRLIRALSLVAPDERKDWTLRIVGPDEGGHLAELRALAAACGVADAVCFAGPKYGPELDAEYAACTCLTLVSHTENFGATVVDALAHGKPVLTGTKTPWREVVDCGCGWWVDNDPESLAVVLRRLFALSATLEGRSELRAMGEKGRDLVERKYTWSAVASRMSDVYHRLCPLLVCGRT